MALRPYKSRPIIPPRSIPGLSSVGEESGEETDPEPPTMALSNIANAPQRSVALYTTRREYALLELLQSERTYVRDLVLLRDYQIPLASGRLSSISSIWPAVDATICQYLGLGTASSDTDVDPIPLAGSSSVGPRLSAVKSKRSAVSFGSIFMKTKDVNIVFNNIQELAAFSEDFLYQLESALGGLIKGNEGEDSVGRLFLDSLAKIEPLYETYVMNQHHAIKHYHRLSQTFQFDVYFPRSQILAHKSSNAWDLPSLLIKPIQRLLHYPQLIAAIIAETPDSHGDIAHLIKAYARMTEMICGLNERWHEQQTQRKVVRDVLAAAGLVAPLLAAPNDAPRTRSRRKSGLKFGLSRGPSIFPRPGSDLAKDVEAAKEDAMARAMIKAGGERLRGCEEFISAFAKGAADWADAMRDLVGRFGELAHGFAGVIWMDRNVDLDADSLVALELLPVLIRDLSRLAGDLLKAEINEDLVQTMESLKGTMAAPMCLVEKMQRLELLYCNHLINIAEPGSHDHPPSSLFEAAVSYVSLRKQLSEELPTYLALLDKGMAVCILKLSHIQRRFYRNVRHLWRGLWDAIKIDKKTNKGAAKTIRIWSRRFSQVEKQLMRLHIARPLGDDLVPAVSNSPGGDLDGYLDPFESYKTGTRRRQLAPSVSPESLVPHPLVTSTRQEKDVLQVPAALYECRVVHAYQPLDGVTYWDLPFFTLVVGEVYEVLVETGHLSTHPDLLPLHVDEGEDRLLLVRHRRTRAVAWALASFMLPIDEITAWRPLSSERGLSPPS